MSPVLQLGYEEVYINRTGWQWNSVMSIPTFSNDNFNMVFACMLNSKISKIVTCSSFPQRIDTDSRRCGKDVDTHIVESGVLRNIKASSSGIHTFWKTTTNPPASNLSEAFPADDT